MILLESKDINAIINKVGLNNFYLQLIDRLIEDFKDWHLFQKCNRHAMYVDGGVIELMPTCNDKYYSFKYVNGHPLNPEKGKLNIISIGMLSDVKTGYPLMLASMNILTAIRTAAVSALASKYLARKSSKKVAIIGCGAQSEFQILAHHAIFNLDEVRCFDKSTSAMQRFNKNLQSETFKVINSSSSEEAITGADIIITATSMQGKHNVLKLKDISPGQHISAVGGDSPGKTELDPEILKHTKVVVEHFPQTKEEGEIQNLDSTDDIIELWEIISDEKRCRVNEDDITVFDAVGFAIEDFSVLKLCYDLAAEFKSGKEIDFVPSLLEDCKDLYGLFLRDQNEKSAETCD
ncbi:MAG: ornithine cyclodeaminase [Legionellaceae bacterium]|nr:ornithine cyclodeaminase [Legionellaceae bacterium]